MQHRKIIVARSAAAAVVTALALALTVAASGCGSRSSSAPPSKNTYGGPPAGPGAASRTQQAAPATR